MARAGSWLSLAIAIGAEVSGSLALKAALQHPAWYNLVVAGYSAAFWFLSASLRKGMPIGVAYGIWGAVGVCLTALLSALIFGEPLTAVMGIGIGLIVAGVLTIELGSQRASDHPCPQQDPLT